MTPLVVHTSWTTRVRDDAMFPDGIRAENTRTGSSDMDLIVSPAGCTLKARLFHTRPGWQRHRLRRSCLSIKMKSEIYMLTLEEPLVEARMKNGPCRSFHGTSRPRITHDYRDFRPRENGIRLIPPGVLAWSV